MIKRVIFDLDNTLIMWQPEYIKALEKTIKKYNLNLDINFVNKLIDDYELIYDYYDKQLLLDYINSKIDFKIDINFIDDFLYNIGFMSKPDEQVIKIIRYLSQKYELVVLTNWFKEPQIERLKHAKIYEYFIDVFGADKVRKPFRDSFITACGNINPSECLMIGDNYDIDVMGAYNAGLEVIYFNPKNKSNENNFKEIKTIEELKNIL